ncbi:DNA alkylation repair protein [Candidatus Dependentiae bacterium Noda2021]|nr:DNA alkylation repair protein [Candidatus Dependentiae bacterium Noda2021]
MNQSDKITQLNAGTLPTSTLMDALSIDINLLLKNTLASIKLEHIPKELGITKKMFRAAELIHDTTGFSEFNTLKQHLSDTIRGLACYLVSLQPISIKDKLELIYPLANDNHFGVREWAWLALRPDVANNLPESLMLLKPWVIDSNENIRRYASEITRPRGVWCSHIKELRKEPWLALDLIQSLHSDSSKYVQLSVANWLNDAGKDHPTWVAALCKEWLRKTLSTHTEKICKRAQRNIKPT